jgi:hypothetical protein
LKIEVKKFGMPRLHYHVKQKYPGNAAAQFMEQFITLRTAGNATDILQTTEAYNPEPFGDDGQRQFLVRGIGRISVTFRRIDNSMWIVQKS